MNKTEKVNLAKKLSEVYVGSGWLFLIDFSGLKAQDTLSIRSDFRKNSATMVVVKNKINNIAMQGTNFASLNQFLKKQVAVVYGDDPVAIAKIIKKYISDNNKISLVMSSDGKNLYDVTAVSKLADLPTVDVLRGQLLGTLHAPLSGLLRLAKELPSAMVRVLDAKSKM